MKPGCDRWPIPHVFWATASVIVQGFLASGAHLMSPREVAAGSQRQQSPHLCPQEHGVAQWGGGARPPSPHRALGLHFSSAMKGSDRKSGCRAQAVELKVLFGVFLLTVRIEKWRSKARWVIEGAGPV